MELNLKDLKELLSVDSPSHPVLPQGKPLYIRGAVYSWYGSVVCQEGATIHLEHAGYVGTDGRYSHAVRDGLENVDASELEHVGDMYINAAFISDWVHLPSLPKCTK